MIQIKQCPFTGEELVSLKDLELALKRESQQGRSQFETTSLLSTQKYSRLKPDEWRSALNREGVVIMIDPKTGIEMVDNWQFEMAYKRLHPSEKQKPPPMKVYEEDYDD